MFALTHDRVGDVQVAREREFEKFADRGGREYWKIRSCDENEIVGRCAG